VLRPFFSFLGLSPFSEEQIALHFQDCITTFENRDSGTIDGLFYNAVALAYLRVPSSCDLFFSELIVFAVSRHSHGPP